MLTMSEAKENTSSGRHLRGGAGKGGGGNGGGSGSGVSSIK